MNRRRPVRSFLTWAFALSLVVHAVTLPFFGLKAQAHGKTETPDQTTITIQPHPKPTPPPTPPPTPSPPVRTPAPARPVAAVRPHRHVVVTAVKFEHGTTATNARDDRQPVSQPSLETSGPDASPGPIATGMPGTPEPTVAPPTETPKPACSKPHADAAVKGDAVEPEFPDSARDAGENGTTQVRVTLAANGDVIDAEVQQSSGFPALDREALKAARASRYSAEIVNCEPAAGQYIFTADFATQ